MRQLETTLTRKGQVTIPLEIRSRLGLKPRDKIRFEMEGDAVRLRAAPSKVLEGYGAVKPRKRPENWKQVREEIEQAIAEEVEAEDQA
ncbi:MAG: AbrB/MazE/SpoVT family DNA-binding domain-containing protein [Chloroflexi bacterium]|nr:AbrB/MazE/SpoVT family DNA-binding domain-containing protein [Chloroflexota bacterium]